MDVPFFDYSKMYKIDYPIYSSELDSVLRRSDFILREDLVRLEEGIAEFTKSKYAIGVANGTDAIWLGLRALGIGVGDEVIIPAHTYVATADAIWAVGATPVVVDIQSDHSINPSAVEEAITSRTKAVIPVNLNGRVAPLDKISALAAEKEIWVIEDNAQGLGAKLENKAAGTFGIYGSLSFYPAKTLGCLGDGGAVLTSNEKIAEKIFRLRSHGRDRKNEVVDWGFNSRLDNLQAAVLNAKLKKLSEYITRRREIASMYLYFLQEIEEVTLPQQYCGGDNRYYDVYQNYEIEAKNRDDLLTFLASKGVGTLIQWGGKGIHQFSLAGIRVKEVSEANRVISSMLLLPMNHYLEDSQIEFVCQRIKEFYGRR